MQWDKAAQASLQTGLAMLLLVAGGNHYIFNHWPQRRCVEWTHSLCSLSGSSLSTCVDGGQKCILWALLTYGKHIVCLAVSLCLIIVL